MPVKPSPTSEDSYHIRIKYLEAELQSFKKEILGNGQPGKLDRMEARFIKALGEFNEKLSHVETKVGKVVIAVAVLAAASGAGATKVVQVIIGAL